MTQFLPPNTVVRTREQAKALAQKKYWDGNPCRRGHFSLRYTTSGLCLQCHASYRSGASAVPPAHGFYQPPDFWLHPDDEKYVREIADGFAMARGFSVRDGAPIPASELPFAPGEIERGGVRYTFAMDKWISKFGHQIDVPPDGQIGCVAWFRGKRVGTFASDLDAMDALEGIL